MLLEDPLYMLFLPSHALLCKCIQIVGLVIFQGRLMLYIHTVQSMFLKTINSLYYKVIFILPCHPVKRNWLKAVRMKGKAQPIMHYYITDQSVETLQGQVAVLLFRDSLPNA